MGQIRSQRQYYIDWLRVLAMLTIFLYHCAKFFDHGSWHVKNNELFTGVSIFVDFVAIWIMPIFFILSGLSSYYSLSRRTGGQYIRERLKRLMVPLVFGIFVLAPPQVYIENVTRSRFSGSFMEFYPHYFDGWYGFGGNFAWVGLHLWYLFFLFIFSLLTLSLFLRLRKSALTARLTILLGKTGATFLLAIPLVIAELLANLQPDGIGRRDMGGWSILVYLVFFAIGYLLACDPQLKPTLEEHRMAALTMGATISTLLIIASFVSQFGRQFDNTFGHILGGVLRPFCSWCWISAILGFGGKYLASSNRLLRYANEAVLPFYVLHQTVIVIIGFWIASWEAGLLVKYLLISISSFAVIMILYELIIGRVNALRFLFGMKLMKKGDSG